MIAFICAMPQEVDALVTIMENVKKDKILHMEIHKGLLCNHECIVALSGVGKVNAAMATTLLIDHFNVEALMNVGVAGGLKEDQNPCDIVISKNVIQHDFDTSFIDGSSGIGLIFPCDAKLVEICSQILSSASIPYFIGDSASGDCFVSKNAYLSRIQELFPECLAAEMEAGAIAQVCYQAQIPCLIIRSLSDITVRDDNHLDFEKFTIRASKQAAWLAKELLEKI